MDDRRDENKPARRAVLPGPMAAAAAMAALLAGPTQAQVARPAAPTFIGAPPPPNFPTALDRDTLLAWLRRETDVLPDRVVAVTPQALTAVVSTFPAGGGQGPRVVIRAEALSAETYARTGALSWHVSLSADCAGRRVKLGDTTGYPERNLLGERKMLRPAESDWRTPEAGTALESALRAACEPDFKGPFASEAAPGATPAPAPPATPPAAAPRPAAVPPAAPKPAPATPKTATAQPPPRASLSVQVGAYADQAEAQAALAKLPQDRSRSLEQATVGGRTWYRLIVWGFATAQDAQRYCDQRKAAGGACFVRSPAKG
jgi:hypothetical protein